MKKYNVKWSVFLVVACMFSAFAQHPEPLLEKEGNKIRITHYYENGDVRETGTYEDGKLDGKWLQYDTEGNIAFEATYVNGEKAGKWFKWEDNGTVLYEMVYESNKLADVQKWKIDKRNMLASE